MATTYIWGTGWESGNPIPASDFYVVGAYSEPVIESGVAKTGDRSLKGNVAPSATVWVRKDISPYSQPSISVYIHPRSRYDTQIVLGSEESSLPNVHFSFGKLHQYVFRWDGYYRTMCLYWRYLDGTTWRNTLLKVGSVKVTENNFFNFQVWASTTFIRAKVDGHLSIAYEFPPPSGSYTNYDYNVLECGKYSVFTEASTGNFDDWIIGHGGWIGDVKVDDLRPVSDSVVGFTPINPANDNYEEIDEVIADDADYNYARTTGLVDKFGIEAFDDTTPEGITKNIVAVQYWVRSKIDAATGDHIDVGGDSNGVEDVERLPLMTAYGYYAHCIEKDPNTAAAWTKAGLDASLLMYESVIA